MDLAGCETLAGVAKLATARQQCNSGAPEHRNVLHTLRREHSEMTPVQHGPFGDEHLSNADVLAASPHIASDGRPCADLQHTASLEDVFLGDDGVGPVRHRCAGRDTVRTVGTKTDWRLPGRGASDCRQPSARLQVWNAPGIAIHRGPDEAWKIKARFERRGNDTACTVDEGHGLGSEP